MSVAHNWTWRSEAKLCVQCGWLFSCRAEDEDRTWCWACTSKMGELKLAEPVQPSVRVGAKVRLEDDLRKAVENTARMQPAEDPD